MKPLITTLTLFVAGTFLTTFGLADDVEDIKTALEQPFS